jgi:hypothetical protein
LSKFWPIQKLPSLARKIGNKIWMERAWNVEQLSYRNLSRFELKFELKFKEFLWVKIEGKFTGKSWNFGFQWNLVSKLLVTPYCKKKSISIKRGSESWFPLKMGNLIDFTIV